MVSPEDEFNASADASYTVPLQASALRVGGYVVLRHMPCRIANMTTTRTGKHGGDKVHITALDIFSERKVEEHFMSTENVEAPIVEKHEYLLIEIDDEGYMTLMAQNAQMREDLKVPDNEMGRQIRFAYETGDELFITTISALGKEQACGWSKKEMKKK